MDPTQFQLPDFLKKILSFGTGNPQPSFGALGAPQSSAGPAANNGIPLNMGTAAPTPGAPLNLQPGNPAQSPGLLSALAQKFGGGQNAQQNGQDPTSPQPNQNNQNDALRAQVLGQAMNLIKQ